MDIEQRAPSQASRSRKLRLAAVGGAVMATAGLAVPIHHFATQSESGITTLQNPETLVTQAPPAPNDPPVVASGEVLAAIAPTYDQIEGRLGGKEESWYQWTALGGSVAGDKPLKEIPVLGALDPELWGCSDEQLSWLDAHGVGAPERLAYGDSEYILLDERLQNTATTGGAISVRNIRVEGNFSDQSPRRFHIACVSDGVGAVAPPVFAIATIGDSTPAVYLENPNPDGHYSADELTPPDLIGTPVAINLHPGEYASMFLFLDSRDASRDFAGRIVADVIVGEDIYEYTLKEGFIQSTEPALSGIYVLAGFGRLFCIPDIDTFWELQTPWGVEPLLEYECTVEQLVDMVAAADAL